jgi:hypothetical protein
MIFPDITTLTGSQFHYTYHQIPLNCGPDQIGAYCKTTRQMFASVAKTFDDAANTEWLVRSYLALKFILGATVMASSAEYAEGHNLQIALPYLNYYTVLNCCRAFLLSAPGRPWKGDKSIHLTHSNIIASSGDTLKRLDASLAAQIQPRLYLAQRQRELFSYRFPASGLTAIDRNLLSVGEAISLARLFTELAQVNLACLESAVQKHRPGHYQILETADTWRLLEYDLGSEILIDDSDWHRVGYFLRKHAAPVALVAMATHGLLEDVFGAWTSPDDNEGYDPDKNWGLLLNV